MSPRRFVRDPHVLWRRTLDAVLVLSPSADAAELVTDPGPALWSLLFEPRTVEDLENLVAAPNGRDADIVRDIVTRLVDCGALLVVG
jgi:hypothetical protein